MIDYTVGESFEPGQTEWPEKGRYCFRRGRHELHVFLKSPTVKELYAIQNGHAQFGLLIKDHVLFLLYRFGLLPWSDDPFNWHLVPMEDRVALPEPETPKQRFHLNIVLVDADTGLIKAVRTVPFTTAFSEALHGAISVQADCPFSPDAMEEEIRHVYREFPTNEAMIRVAQVRCNGVK